MEPITEKEIKNALRAVPRGTFMRKRVIAKHIAKKRVVDDLGVENFSDISFSQRRKHFDPVYREVRRVLRYEMRLRNIPGIRRRDLAAE